MRRQPPVSRSRQHTPTLHKKSDGKEVCASGDQLAAVFAGTAAGAQGKPTTGAPASQPAPLGEENTGTAISTIPANDNQLPVIHINGNNPATVQVGVSYTDLPATITGPKGDLNLGVTTLLDGATTATSTATSSAQ